jgi:hypothetical protein
MQYVSVEAEEPEMTELLQELERKLAELPTDEQEAWLSRFLKELSLEGHEPDGHALAEEANDEKGEWISGRRPTKEEISDAVRRLKELSKGNILGDDITLKDLINGGRRY